MMLGGRHRKIVVSTLSEIVGCIPLVQDGLLDECLYGLPIRPGALPELASISQSRAATGLNIALLIDNHAHVRILETFVAETAPQKKWDVFIKIDIGYQRAGVDISSPALPDLVRRVEESDAVHLRGFYCHAGHSYACRTEAAAAEVLQAEVRGVVEAAKHLSADRELVVSVGSTPTAHVVQTLKSTLPENLKLELHAGNFPCNDLQQVSTGLVAESQQALRVLAEVCSVYSERNEALINAGTIALSKETSDYPGYGQVVGHPGWSVVRTSQEHGILGLSAEQQQHAAAARDSHDESGSKERAVEEVFEVGQKVFLHCNHACITAAAHFVYYVVDDEDVVREVWVPWKGW